jgi:hypothetical protein
LCPNNGTEVLSQLSWEDDEQILFICLKEPSIKKGKRGLAAVVPIFYSVCEKEPRLLSPCQWCREVCRPIKKETTTNPSPPTAKE